MPESTEQTDVRVAVTIPRETDVAVEVEAARQQISKSQAFAEALADWLKRRTK
jgi:hypothetical protein